MATIKSLRKDLNGHIISKEEKNYQILFNDNIDIINVKSYKKFNLLEDDCEDYSDETSDTPNEENFIDTYQKANIEQCSVNDPKAFSKGGCCIFNCVLY